MNQIGSIFKLCTIVSVYLNAKMIVFRIQKNTVKSTEKVMKRTGNESISRKLSAMEKFYWCTLCPVRGLLLVSYYIYIKFYVVYRLCSIRILKNVYYVLVVIYHWFLGSVNGLWSIFAHPIIVIIIFKQQAINNLQYNNFYLHSYLFCMQKISSYGIIFFT